MYLNIFDDISSWLFHRFYDTLDFLFDSLAEFLRVLFSIFFTPARLGLQAAEDIFGTSAQWTPVFLLVGGAVFLLVLLLLCWAILARKGRNK